MPKTTYVFNCMLLPVLSLSFVFKLIKYKLIYAHFSYKRVEIVPILQFFKIFLNIMDQNELGLL